MGPARSESSMIFWSMRAKGLSTVSVYSFLVSKDTHLPADYRSPKNWSISPLRTKKPN